MKLLCAGRETLLSYGANVHPAETLAEVWTALRTHAVPLKRLVSPDAPLGVGLHLSAAAAEPLAGRPESAEGFRAFLRTAGLDVFTLNAFPYGNFHADVVKEAVYRPDWTTPRRLEYTIRAGKALATLMDEGRTGTVSTLPVSWKAFGIGADGLRQAAANLLGAAEAFRAIREETGRNLILCLEPEPLCTLETTEETVAFFERFLQGAEASVREHLGVCFDTCHLAVQFEDLDASVKRLRATGIRIGKVQLSSALVVKDPARRPEAARALRSFAEPRFLHQVASLAGRLPDLPALEASGPEWEAAPEWRCHFHVPLDRAAFPPLETTQADVRKALPALLAMPERPHFEVETYTWTVLPEAERPEGPQGLVEGLARELLWAREALAGPTAAPVKRRPS